MSKGMDIGAAIDCLREGKRVARMAWEDSITIDRPLVLVLVKGREITPTFEPMLSVTAGQKFYTDDHIDAVYRIFDEKAEYELRYISDLSYQFTQKDVLATDWFVVE